MSWGVNPVPALYQQDANVLFTHAIDCAKNYDLVYEGELVVITAGNGGCTDVLKVMTVPGLKR